MLALLIIFFSIFKGNLIEHRENPYIASKDDTLFESFQQQVEFPPNQCNKIFNLMEQVKDYEVWTNHWRYIEQGHSYLKPFKKFLTNIQENFSTDSKSLEEKGLSGKNLIILSNLNVFDYDNSPEHNEEDSYNGSLINEANSINEESSIYETINNKVDRNNEIVKDEDSNEVINQEAIEKNKKKSAQTKLFSYMIFPEDFTDYSKVNETTEQIIKESKKIMNWGKFGRVLSKLMFVYDYDEKNNNFLCLRSVEAAHFIFKLIYLNYMEYENDVKLFLRNFLEGFFTPKKNWYEREVFYKLFRSFYSIHLSWFLKLDQKFIMDMTNLFNKIHSKEVQNYLIENFIDLYLIVMKSLDFTAFQEKQKRENIDILDNFNLFLRDVSIEASIFAYSYAIAYIKSFLPSIKYNLGPVEIKYDIDSVLKILNINTSIDAKMFEINDFSEKEKNDFVNLFDNKLKEIGWELNNKDIKNIYEIIKTTVENSEKCGICENNKNFNDYVVYNTEQII